MWLRAIALLILLVAQGDALEDYQILAQIKTYWNITASASSLAQSFSETALSD